MRKPNSKLIASAFLVLISISLMVTVSYAWFTMSATPALAGVQINIGGSNTIKIAPNMTKEVDGDIVNYPGYFQETMDITKTGSYSYLEDSIGLTPVSTADGIHWFMPEDSVSMGTGANISLNDYQMDNLLEHANITVGETAVDGKSGSYIYLDFWVVSPMDYCNLRVSIGDATEGSYLIGLPSVTKDSSSALGYSLNESDNEVAACARVGFLVNTEVAQDDSMQEYSDSRYYANGYKKLKGVYQESGESVTDASNYRFTIYEPNGDMHNGVGISYIQGENGLTYLDCDNGDYVVTKPIGYENGQVALKNISNILTVQKTNKWKAANEEESLLSQIFESSLYNKNLDGMSEEEIAEQFYSEELQNNYANYVNRATFFESTRELYFSGDGTVTTEQQLPFVDEDTATKDAIIVELERNVPQRIRMYVWLEGQDVDCVREAALESFALGIELAGSTQD